MWLHCYYQWRKSDVTTVSDGNFHQKFYLQGQCYIWKNRRNIFHIKIISAKGEDSYSIPNIFLLFYGTSLFFFWRMNCLTPLFAWRGCAQPWTSSDLFCSIFKCHTSFMLHLVLSWSATFNKRLQFAHVMAWDRGQLCYGCNTTVIFMMKRTIYFLMTSNNQEVLSDRITTFNLCCWNFPSHWKLWCRQAEDGIPIFIIVIFRSDTWCHVDAFFMCACAL